MDPFVASIISQSSFTCDMEYHVEVITSMVALRTLGEMLEGWMRAAKKNALHLKMPTYSD